MTFEYENLPLLKSPQNNVGSNIAITEKNISVRHIIYVIDFTDEPVVKCDVPAVKNTSLDDDANDDCK